MRGRRQAKLTALLLLSGLVAVACSSGEDDVAEPRVTIYSGRTQNLIEPILERFAEETSYDIDVRYGLSSDLALLIDEEGDKSPADVFLSQSPGSVGHLDAEGLLASLPDDVLDLVPEHLRAGDGSWVGFSGRKRVLVYNPGAVSPDELPDSVLELTDPRWKGRVGIAPPNASFQDFVTAMRTNLGDETTSGWLEGLRENDVFTYANNNAIVAAVDRGELDVGLVNHYYVYQMSQENPDLAAKNHDLAPEDVGSLLIVTAATMLKTAKNKEASAALVAFLLTEDAQRYFSDQTYEYPLAHDVAAADVLPPVEFVETEGIDLDKLGGDLESTRRMIADAGLQG